jgi:hypothetical protein
LFSEGAHGVEEPKESDDEEEEGCDAAATLKHTVAPWERQARRRRGFAARGEVTETRAAAACGYYGLSCSDQLAGQSSAGSVKIM